MTTLTDNFNRANGDIGTASGGHTYSVAAGDFNISGNECTNVGGEGLVQAAADLASDDHHVQAKIAAAPNNWGLTARHQDSDNFYLIQTDGTASILELFKNVGGFSLIADTGSLTLSDGDVIKLECNGTALKAYENGIERISATDSSLSGIVRCGMRAGGANQFWDDFEAADLGAGGGTTIPVLMRSYRQRRVN